MSFSKWVHPKTGEVRVYFNGSNREIKSWFTATEIGTIAPHVSGGYVSQQDAVLGAAEKSMTDLFGGNRPATFVELLTAIGG